MFRAAALLLPLLAAACGGIEGEDWILVEARSPDRTHVARLWCEQECDVAGRLTLTISPASRHIALNPSEVPDFPAEGRVPDQDVRATFAIAQVRTKAEPDGAEAQLRWRDARTVEVLAPCPDRTVTGAPAADGIGFVVRPRPDAPCPTDAPR
ncbi:hypothetical protein ACG3SL_14575 [Sphingomonas sp. CJ20]